MRRLFAIYSVFLDIRKSIIWYQNHFLITKNRFFHTKKSIQFLDIKNSFSPQKIDFWISKHGIDFFYISKILFLDITKLDWFCHIKNSRNVYFNIKNDFLISRNTELVVKRPFYYLFHISFISKNISFNQTLFLISKHQIKSKFWYQIVVLITKNRILDIK